MTIGWRVLLLVALPVGAALAGYLILGPEGWRPTAILARRDALRDAAEARPLLVLALFVAAHFVIVSSALPVGPPMSLLAGFLFGRWLGTAAILCGSTVGALVLFRLVRFAAGTTFDRRLRARIGPAYDRLADGFRANAFGYLLVMRLLPVLPFSLVNAAAGLAGLPTHTFLAATLIGRLPAAFLYVSLGQELGRVSRLDELATPAVALTLTGLAALTAVPVVVAAARRRRT